MKSKFISKETVKDLGVVDRGFSEFRVGDTIDIAQKITEGSKERIQMFRGIVISFNKNGIATTFTVRRIGANNIGVEKIFPYYSPLVDDIKIVKRGDVARAKIFYIRDRVGKAANVKEKIVTKVKKNLAKEKAENNKEKEVKAS